MATENGKAQPSDAKGHASKPKEYVLLTTRHSQHLFAKYASTNTSFQ